MEQDMIGMERKHSSIKRHIGRETQRHEPVVFDASPERGGIFFQGDCQVVLAEGSFVRMLQYAGIIQDSLEVALSSLPGFYRWNDVQLSTISHSG